MKLIKISEEQNRTVLFIEDIERKYYVVNKLDKKLPHQSRKPYSFLGTLTVETKFTDEFPYLNRKRVWVAGRIGFWILISDEEYAYILLSTDLVTI